MSPTLERKEHWLGFQRQYSSARPPWAQYPHGVRCLWLNGGVSIVFTYYSLFETFNWSYFRGGDTIDYSSEAGSSFDLDWSEEDPSPSCKPDQPQPQVMLEDLKCMESLISQIWDYSFEHEKGQWTEDKLGSFLDPPHELWNLDDPQLHLSLWIYLSLTAHSSEVTYNAVCSNIKECYPESTMLLFDQVQTQLKVIMGIIPLHSDMYINTCLAYTSPFAPLTDCPFCREHQYECHLNVDSKTPCCQFVTLPLGPQFQALWRHPISVAKLQDCLWCTAVLLAQRDTSGGIQDYDNVCCGSEYPDLVKSGQIADNDMLLALSMDGAQLY